MPEHGTKIEWTHVPGYTGTTWNPVTGCSRVSPGCQHCYAEELGTGRLKGTPGYPGLPWTVGNAAVNVIVHPDRLEDPLRWRMPRAVFVNSMSDLFHEIVPDSFLDQVFAVMALTPQHIYMVLTKRSARMKAYLQSRQHNTDWVAAAAQMRPDWTPGSLPWPLPNVWQGVSVEDQPRADERIPRLLAAPAAVRFVSAEPLLAPVDFENVEVGEYVIDALGAAWAPGGPPPLNTTLDWVIVGGESGPSRRAMDVHWLWDIVRQCRHSETPVFVKQDSAHRPGQQGRIADDYWAEKHWPEVPSTA